MHRKAASFYPGSSSPLQAAQGKVRVEWSEPAASWPYVEMTLAMMKEAGIRFEQAGFQPDRDPGAPGLCLPQFHSRGRLFFSFLFLGRRRPDRRGGLDLTRFASQSSGRLPFSRVSLGKMGCRIIWEREGVRVKGPEQAPAHRYRHERNAGHGAYAGCLSAFASGTPASATWPT